MSGTIAERLELDATPRCGLVAICAAPADVGGFCRGHRDELNERIRRDREETARSQRRFWLEEIGLPRRYWDATFDSVRSTAPVRRVLEYRDARGIGRGRALGLGGPTGTGKTTAVAALINDLLPYLQARQRFYLAAQLVRELLDFDTAAEVMEEAASVRLLIVDDLQMPARAEGLAVLEELLVRREAEGLPIVITSNLRRTQFEAAFGDRVADRLRAWGDYYEAPGKSLRSGGT
jgi:DNA replication protein DnaC